MRSLLRLFVPLAVGTAAVLLLWQAVRARTEALSLRGERERLKREFVERSAVARALGGDRSREAGEESQALFRWYFDELQELRNRFPHQRQPEGLEALMEQRPKATPEEKRTLEEFYKYAEERFQAMRSGRYDPIYVSSSSGFRLDLLGIQSEESPITKERGLRIDFALWGAPRRTDRETQPGGHELLHASIGMLMKQLTFRFLDADGKPWGEMSGTGEPYVKLTDPERLVPDFPPGLLFGTWHVDPFPREAARVVMTLQVQPPAQTSAVLLPTFTIEAPVPEEWKLLPGQSFHGEVREDASLAPVPRGTR